jgi:hypothetical protein
MGRSKGSNKTGGRKKGTPNKNSTRLEASFTNEGIDIGSELVRIYKNFSSDQDKLKILFRIMDYVYPRQKSVLERQDEVEVKDQTIIYKIIECPSPDDLNEETKLELQPG